MTQPPSASLRSAERLFAGGGETGALMQAIDWSQTPLGPVESWPQSLRTALRICLTSRHPLFVWWGPQFIKLYNDPYIPVTGKRHPWALGKPGREVWPEIWHIIGPMLESVLTTGQATWSDDQLLLLERNGYPEETYFTFSYSPIEDESGGVGGVFTAVYETTPRVLAERRTQASRELIAAIVNARIIEEVYLQAAQVLEEHAQDVPFALLYRLDASDGVAHLAASAGLPGGTLLSPARVLLSDESACWPLGQVMQANQAKVVTGLAAAWGEQTVRAGREMTPHTALVLPVTQPGQVHPTAILVAGVSPRRALDDDYQAFYDLLVSHLRRAIVGANAHEAERRRAEALAEIDRAKTAFFSNVSHEFRTPLTLMLGPLADMLGTNQLAPDLHNQLAAIHRNGLRLLKLVNTLLDFSRIEAGRAQATYVPTDLAALTSDLASVFRSLIEKAGLRLTVDCPPLAEPVYVDRDMWEKIVLNLLSNAFKFTFSGEIAVSLHQQGHQVQLIIRDTGTGIPPEEVPRLFERFHRVQGARSRTHEGSGIGLSLVQELVHLHGGTIGVQSQVGVGTTFTITLPLGAAHLPADRIQDSQTRASTAFGTAPFVEEARRWLPEEPSDEQPGQEWLAQESPSSPPFRLKDAQQRPARILLADDNADLRDYLRRLLRERYEVEAVADGAAALAAARSRPPDLVLSDVMMPGLDGFALLRELRADPRLRGIPVILLSARAGEEATIEGLAAGADDYLIKPFSARELLARVEGHLEMARLRRVAAEARVAALEEANRQMDEFLGIASHELRTPLTSIMANFQMAQKATRQWREEAALPEAIQGKLERYQGLLERTGRQLNRLNRLVGDLLDVSRIRVGKLELHRERCELGAILQEAIEAQRAAWPGRQITLEGQELLPLELYADADRLGQVVTNYLINALKYSAPDQPVLVKVRQEPYMLRVTVQDYGPGLTLEQQARLFERFFRVPGIKQQSGSGMGLGLGLYICKTIIERHDGQVGVASTPGQGSIFWFTLPPAAQYASSSPSAGRS